MSAEQLEKKQTGVISGTAGIESNIDKNPIDCKLLVSTKSEDATSMAKLYFYCNFKVNITN